MLGYVLGDHDGAVLPAGAAKGNRQVAFALMDVVRKQVDEQIGNARDEFPRLRKRANVFRHTPIAAGERPELGNEVRIGQEADIENEICVLRNAPAETEAHTGDQNALLGRPLLKALVDVSAEFMDIELGGIDDEVGEAANGSEVTALCFERGLDGRVGTQGMRTAGLAETAQKNGVGGLEEDDLGRDHASNRFEDAREFLQLRAFANVDDERGAADFAGLHSQFREFRDQLDRKVIDAVVAEIFEGLQYGGLSRTAHSGNEDQFRWVRPAPGFVSSALRPLFAGRPSGLHALDSSIEHREMRSVLLLIQMRAHGSSPRMVREREFQIVSAPHGPVSYGVMKKFEDLTEREVLALAIALEEEDERVYADFSEGLRQDYPATASMFDGMREEESGHRRRLLELFQKKFGEHIPLIRRQDVRGFVDRPALWLVRPLRIEAVRKEASTMEVETRRFYEKAAARTQDASIRQLLDDLATEEREHENRAQELDKQKLPDNVKADEEVAQRRLFVLQIVQPGLAGLMDGSVSTLAPVFAAAFATQKSWDAFLVGLAASAGAGISMGFAEALSDDGSLTGRGHPWVRGVICGAMTALGGIGHTLPFLIRDFRAALWAAGAVVLAELGVITWIRQRYMDTPWVTAALQVGLGGVLVFITGVLIGSS